MNSVSLILLAFIILFPDDQEDLEFARKLQAHGFRDISEKILKDLIDNTQDNFIRSQAETELESLKFVVVHLLDNPESKSAKLRELISGLKETTKNNLDNNTFFVKISELMYQYQRFSQYLHSIKNYKEAEQALDEATATTEELRNSLDRGPQSEPKTVLLDFYYADTLTRKIDLFKSVKDASELDAMLSKLKKHIRKRFGFGKEGYPAFYSAYSSYGKSLNIMASKYQTKDPENAAKLWNEALEKFKYVSDTTSILYDNIDSPSVKPVIFNGIQLYLETVINYADFIKKRRGDYQSLLIRAVKATEEVKSKLKNITDPDFYADLEMKRADIYELTGQPEKTEDILKALMASTTIPKRIKDAILQKYPTYNLSSVPEIIELAQKDLDEFKLFNAIAKLKSIIYKAEDNETRAKVYLLLANSYKTIDRHYEALELYREIEKNYQSFEEVYNEMLQNKYATLSRLINIFGEKKLQDELAKAEQEIIDRGIESIEIRAKKAREYEDNGKYKKSLEEWKKLTDLKNPEQQMSVLYHIVKNSYVLYNQKSLSADELLKSIEELLGLSKDVKQKSRSSMNFIASAYAMLSEVLIKQKQYHDLLARTKGFITDFANSRPEYQIKVLYKRIEALCEIEKVEEADKEFLALEEIFKSEKKGLNDYRNALITLSSASNKIARETDDAKLKEKLLNDYVSYTKKLRSVGGSGLEGFEQQLQTANTFFTDADIKLSKTPFEKIPEAAKESAKNARQLYESLLDNKEEARNRDLETSLEWRIIKCHYIEGNFDNADRLISKLAQKLKNDADLFMLKADIEVRKAIEESEHNKKMESYTNAQQQYAQISNRASKISEHYFKALYCKFKVSHVTGDVEKLAEAISLHEELNGNAYDDNEFGYKQLFESLKKEIQHIDPRR